MDSSATVVAIVVIAVFMLCCLVPLVILFVSLDDLSDSVRNIEQRLVLLPVAIPADELPPFRDPELPPDMQDPPLAQQPV